MMSSTRSSSTTTGTPDPTSPSSSFSDRTLIANYLPLEGPAGGPNFYEFGDDVLYEILIDNDGDARPNISFQFLFRSDLDCQLPTARRTGGRAQLLRVRR